jgi:hypothetical protein
MIRRISCVVALAVALLATSVPAASAATVAPSKWAPKFCTAFLNVRSTVTSKADALKTQLDSVTDLTVARDTIVASLGEMADAADLATNKVKAAGTPSFENGAKISAFFVKGLKSASKNYRQAQSEAKQLPTDNAGTFRTKGEDISNTLASSGDELGANFAAALKLDKGKLLAALREAPACAPLSSS